MLLKGRWQTFLFYWSYILMVWLVLLNCVIAIVNYGYEAAKARETFLFTKHAVHDPRSATHNFHNLYVLICGNPLFLIHRRTRHVTGTITASELEGLLRHGSRLRVRFPKQVTEELVSVSENKRSLSEWNHMQWKLRNHNESATDCAVCPAPCTCWAILCLAPVPRDLFLVPYAPCPVPQTPLGFCLAPMHPQPHRWASALYPRPNTPTLCCKPSDPDTCAYARPLRTHPTTSKPGPKCPLGRIW